MIHRNEGRESAWDMYIEGRSKEERGGRREERSCAGRKEVHDGWKSESGRCCGKTYICSRLRERDRMYTEERGLKASDRTSASCA